MPELVANSAKRVDQDQTASSLICSSAPFRQDVLDPRRVLRDVVETVGQVNARRRGWASCHREPRTPFGGRPDRARYEAAATVRADVLEPVDALGAERAFVLQIRAAVD